MIWFSRRGACGKGSGQREKAWRNRVGPRDVASSGEAQSLRDAASRRGSAGLVGGAHRRGERGRKSVREDPRDEKIWGTKKRAGSAHLPDHLIGLHGGRSPGPLAEGRSRPTRSRARARECSRGRALAGSSSSRKNTPAALQPPTKLDRAHFRAPGVKFFTSIGPHFKRERAPRVGHYRSFARARGVSTLGDENATARISGVRSSRVSLRPRLKRSRAIARAKHGASRVSTRFAFASFA